MMFNASLVEDVDKSPEFFLGTITKLQNYSGKPYKKTIKSVIMIIPREGGGGGQRSNHLRFFSSMLPTYLVGLRTPQNKLCTVLTPNSIFHIYSNLFDPLYLKSHLS